MKYTFQRIGRKFHGDGVGFCAKEPMCKDNLRLVRSCDIPHRHPVDASSIHIGAWLSQINQGDDADMVRCSHYISRSLYESNSKPKDTEHEILIHKLGDKTIIAEVRATLTTSGGCFDIDSGVVISQACFFNRKIYFNSKSSWLYKAIMNDKVNI